MYYQSREDLKPYRDAYGFALPEIQRMLKEGPGGFTDDPIYQFKVSEGVKALERSAAARGNQLSGAQQKAITRFGQDYAMDEWYRSQEPYFRLAGLGAGPGMTGAQQALSAGQSLGQNALTSGFGQASNYLTQGQLWGDAASNIGQTGANLVMNPQMPWNQLQGQPLTQNQLYTQTGAPSALPSYAYNAIRIL